MLVGVILSIAKRRFHDVLTDLQFKYTVKSQYVNEFLSNGQAMFRSGDDWIAFNAPHLSFLITLSYVTDEIWRESSRSFEEENSQKRQHERSKL